MASASSTDPKVVLTNHACERIDERVAPKFPKDRNPYKWVTAMVHEAIRENSFSRKPPLWCRAKRLPRGTDIRFIKAKICDEPVLIVASRKKKTHVVVTVITRSRASHAA